MVGGYLSLLYSISDKPLEYWSKRQSQSGRIRKILDSDLIENVIEIQDFEQPHGYGTSILCPSDSSQFLNIELPILVIVVKNLNLQCRVQVQVVDTQNCLHHFQFSNADFEKHNFRDVICRVKVKLESGWNKLELNLSNLTQAAFKRQYSATQRLEICGNCRLRRVYFIDKHYENLEIDPKLYHGFLDFYMLKWGVNGVERSTQTSKKSKSRIRENNAPAKRTSEESLNGEETKRSNAKDTKTEKARKIDKNFLRSLQIKNEMLINDFFDRQRTKLPYALEFKQQAKVKPYAFPKYATDQQKTFTSNIVSEDALKKINILRTFTDMYVSMDTKQKEERFMKNIEENWNERYSPHKEDLVNNADVKNPSANLNNSIANNKPRSLLLLSQIKSTGGRGKPQGQTKKHAETIKRNDSETVVS